MKRKFTLLFMLLVTVYLNGDGIVKKIELKGQLTSGPRIASIDLEPVQAFQQNDLLLINYNLPVGFVYLTVYDGYGSVLYSNVVDTKNNSYSLVKLDGQRGDCRLVLSNSEGMMWGDFVW